MARAFAFRFQQILEIRRLKEDLAARDLALAQQAVREQNARILRLLSEEAGGKEALKELRRNVVDLVQLRLQEGWLLLLERRIRTAAEALQDLARVEAGKRTALTEARKEVRVLEKYRERQLKAWRASEDLAERKVLDEIAQNVAGTES